MNEELRKSLLETTRQPDLPAAIRYIAEDLFLPPNVDPQRLMAAVIESGGSSDIAEVALRRLSRIAAKSDLDTAAVLLKPEWLTPPSVYRRALDLLASKTSSGRLDRGLDARAVYAAQRQNDRAVDTLLAVAGLSWRELADRASISSPSDPTGDWTLQEIEKAFAIIDDVVCDRVKPALVDGFAARPVELLGDPDVTGAGQAGWDKIETFRTSGVSYEALLAQRVEGGAWRSHRDRIGRKYAHVLANTLCDELEAHEIGYRRARNSGGDVENRQIADLVGGGAQQVGVVIVNPTELPTAAIVISVANDGGSASKSGTKVMNICDKLTVPVYVVVAGLGWQHRNETADLARKVKGRIYTEKSLSRLALALTA